MSHAPSSHPYHLVDPSPWPLLSSIAAFLFTTGAVLSFHDMGHILLIVGVIAILICMFGWWRDIIHESRSGVHHTEMVNIGLRYGMLLFIASEVMFFVAFFWAYFDSFFFPKEAIGFQWPPADIKVFDPFDLPLLNTLILLLSGTTVTWAHHALLHKNRDHLVAGLFVTVSLGLIFSVLQGVEYSHAAFGLADGIYPSTFYLATGFHGFHVIVGTIFLAVCLFRAMRGHFTETKHVGFEAAAWYWHFVDVVWLFLFIGVYWLGS